MAEINVFMCIYDKYFQNNVFFNDRIARAPVDKGQEMTMIVLMEKWFDFSFLLNERFDTNRMDEMQ